MELISKLPPDFTQTKINQEKKTDLFSKAEPSNAIKDRKNLYVGIGAAIGISAAILGGILYSKKINAIGIKKLAENIEFKEGQTLKEAIEFGRKNLGIKKYLGFKEEDLEVINWVNEGLTRINNLTKGKACMPKKIEYKLFNFKNNKFAATMNSKGELKINRSNIKMYRKFVEKNLKRFSESEERNKLLNHSLNSKNFKNCINTFFELVSLNEKEAERIGRKVHCSTFSNINHEMGHLQHFRFLKKNPDFYEEMSTIFQNSKHIAPWVSDYASTSPTEFVAEVFSYLCDAKTLNMEMPDKEVLELYKKLGGFIF